MTNRKNMTKRGAVTYERELGLLGEALAAGILKSKGYHIIAKNYTCPYGEIDIIAVRGREIAFTEVKTRTSEVYGRPAEAVDYRKRQHIKNAARYFLAASKRGYSRVDFHVVEILANHIEGLEL